MKVHTAQLPGAETSADRVIVSPDAVIVLDGASAFLPVDVEPGTYAETLGRSIAAELHRAPGTPIADAVAEGIRRTTEKLDLRAGASPSSTVAILRARSDVADLYVLGDSPIHYGIGHRAHSLTDDRLSKVATPEHEHYLHNSAPATATTRPTMLHSSSSSRPNGEPATSPTVTGSRRPTPPQLTTPSPAPSSGTQSTG